MGVGGFFNYEKPGPGVSKDAPKKKLFFAFLEVWFRNFWKLSLVSLVYSLMGLFLIPCGLAEAGMANVCRNLARDKHSFGLSDFFATIKKNWKQALPVGLINLIITALLAFALYFYSVNGGIISILAFGVCFVCFTVFTFMKYHIWLILITFKLPAKNIYKNCFLFAFVNLKYNILIAVISIALTAGLTALFFTYYPILWVLSIVIMIAVMPGFVNLFTQFCIFPKVKTLMIDPYYAEHKGEDVSLRRGLGLEIEEEDDENVFDDMGKTEETKKEEY